MFTIRLKPSEHAAACSLGVKRESLRRARGKVQDFDQRGDKGGTLNERNAIGALAEYALAKYLGLDVLRDWCENKAFSLDHSKITSDVGKNIQVRASANPRATLWVYHHDNYPTAPFVLARVDGLDVTFVGWVFGSEGQNPEWWDRLGWSRFGPDRAAYNVPHEALKPMQELPDDCVR